MVTVFSPAKLNLLLAVTGRRADGFHQLVSVAAKVDFGDELRAEPADGFSLSCDNPALPVDESNLVLKAARLFARETGWKGGARFALTKRIPVGAGLGGGSSNAVAALRALERLAGAKLPEEQFVRLATALGSDCALFLGDRPVVMRGRGDLVQSLPDAAVRRLSSRRVLIFKSSFGIATAWAYQRMAARGTDYVPATEAESRLSGWIDSSAPAEELLFNNMELAAFEKYVALPELLEALRREFDLAPRMSGSGSACFAFLRDGQDAEPILRRIRECWGEGAFLAEARLE